MKSILMNPVMQFPFSRSDFSSRSKPIFQYISNRMQRYTVYFIWKLLYMFRVVLPPIIRRANNCIYSIWYLSHCYCYLPLETALHVSGGTTTHHQKRKQLYLLTYLLTPWSRVLLEKLTSKLCS